MTGSDSVRPSRMTESDPVLPSRMTGCLTKSWYNWSPNIRSFHIRTFADSNSLKIDQISVRLFKPSAIASPLRVMILSKFRVRIQIVQEVGYRVRGSKKSKTNVLLCFECQKWTQGTQLKIRIHTKCNCISSRLSE